MNSYVSAITPWRGGCEADGVGWIVTLKIKEKMILVYPRMN